MNDERKAAVSGTVGAVVGKVFLAVSSQGSADTMEIHGVFASREAAEQLAWSKNFGDVEEWEVIDFANNKHESSAG